MIPLLLLALVTQAESPQQAADRLFREGRFPESAAAYAGLGDSPEASFNRGCALLESGEPEAAASAFRSAADGPGDIAARARFNLGHALLRLAQKPPNSAQTGEDPPGASAPRGPDPKVMLERLRHSAAAFRSVLDVDPTDAEAARNTELVRRMIRDLERQMQQAAERQKRMQEQADKLDRLADEQQEQADQSRQSPPSQSEQRQQRQEELNERTKQAQQELAEQLGAEPEAGQASRQLQEAINEQQESMEDLAQRRPDRASEDMQQAADNLRQAAQSLREASEQQPGQPGEQQGAQDQQQQQQQGENAQPQEPKSEAEQLAERILQAEQSQREARERTRRLYAVPVPVEKDW